MIKKFFLIVCMLSLGAAFVCGENAILDEEDTLQVPNDEEAQAGERLTQEEFAVELVKLMKLDGRLPTAALSSDCITFLEKLGIMPLSGWDAKALLNQEDYLVVLAKIHGKEKMLHERAAAVEEKNIQVINQKWKESQDKDKRWPPLKELLKDKRYFPNGPPMSPYGFKYRDRNNDHKVDMPFLPISALMDLRDALSTQ